MKLYCVNIQIKSLIPATIFDEYILKIRVILSTHIKQQTNNNHYATQTLDMSTNVIHQPPIITMLSKSLNCFKTKMRVR